MNHKILAFVACASAAATMAVFAIGNNEAPSISTFAGITPSAYSCASVHFGMDDGSLKGDANLGSADAVSVGDHTGSIGVVNGITMTSHSVSNQAVYAHTNAGLKMSSAKKNSTLAITFNASVCACTIYAIGWKGDDVSISVNGGDSQAITSSDIITGTSTVGDVEYAPYFFEFDASNTITIAATKRLVIGDISLRVSL